MIFVSGKQELLAEMAADGRIFLLDTGSLVGTNHNTPLAVTSVGAGSHQQPVVSDALASWEDETGVRWLLAASNGAIVAWKLKTGAKLSLEPAWTSRDLIAPLTPIVV